MKLKTILGQPSWHLASTTVEAYVTQLGGHIGPITFKLGNRKIMPYSVAPWATEELEKGTPAILRALRGDFFCCPFGGNEKPYRGERHPVHGETANAKWRLDELRREAPVTALHLWMPTKIRRGRVDKIVSLVNGDTAVYERHILSGMSGPMNLGHHAMLKFPDREGAGLISTSRTQYMQVFPEPVERPEARGYSILQPGAVFDRLDKVPTITGQMADLSRYPARRGFEDIVILVSAPDVDFAWTAVAFPQEGYVWFAIKDPRVLRSSLFWISNGGRHYAPWNSRHVNVMGLEEITSFFHTGLAESATPNSLSNRGIPTALQLDPAHPTTVNYIMAVAGIPHNFDHVQTIEPTDDARGVVLISRSGKSVTTSLDLRFLTSVGA